jgi:hypothetical protein
MSVRNIAVLSLFALFCLSVGAAASYVVVTQPQPEIYFLPGCEPI